MKRSSIVVFVYTLFVLIGGIIGFVKAQSQASLVMSLLFAVGLSLCGWAMLKGHKLGLVLASLLILCLGAFFCYRFFLNYHFMPAGLMSLLSLAALGFLLIPCGSCNKCCADERKGCSK